MKYLSAPLKYQDFDKALERIRHHQLDMLFSATQPQRYWINEPPLNPILEKLLLATADPVFVRETVSGRQIAMLTG